jgi:hypothetical protein
VIARFGVAIELALREKVAEALDFKGLALAGLDGTRKKLASLTS